MVWASSCIFIVVSWIVPHLDVNIDFMFSFILIVLVHHWYTLHALCRSQLFLGDMQYVSLCVLVFDCCVWLLHDRGVDPLSWLRPAWFHVVEHAHIDFGVLADSVYFCFRSLLDHFSHPLMQGGAVHIMGGSGTFHDCTFTGNTAVSVGVGITICIYCFVLDCSSLGCEYSRIADSTSCFLLYSLCWCIIDAPYLIYVGRNSFSVTCRA